MTCFNCGTKLTKSTAIRHSADVDICGWCAKTVTIDRLVLDKLKARILEQVAGDKGDAS